MFDCIDTLFLSFQQRASVVILHCGNWGIASRALNEEDSIVSSFDVVLLQFKRCVLAMGTTSTTKHDFAPDSVGTCQDSEGGEGRQCPSPSYSRNFRLTH